MAVNSGYEATVVYTTPNPDLTFCVKTIRHSGTVGTDIDFTCSTSGSGTSAEKWKIFGKGTVEPGTISFSAPYDETVHNDLYALIDDAAGAWEIIFADGSKYATSGGLVFFQIEANDLDGVVNMNAEIQCTGVPTVTLATS